MRTLEENKNYQKLYIHNQKEYKKFEKYAQQKGINPIKLLYKIHKEMGISKRELGHFGPKTIKYLKKIYKKENFERRNKLEFQKEHKQIIEKKEKKLYDLNEKTLDLVSKNNLNTRKKVGKIIHGSIDIGYGIKNTSKNIELKTDKIEVEIIEPGIIEVPGGVLYQNGQIIYKDSSGDISKTYDLHYAIDNQINNETIKEKQKEREYFITEFGIDPGPVDTNKKSPLDILAEMYKNSSENDKIKMAMVLGKYMLTEGYDYDMAKNDKGKDISSEKMWEIYRQGGVAGVCRHMHSEVAKFLEKVGIKAGVLTTNSKNGRHVITMGKLKNGNYFLIDYGNYFESKNFLDMKTKYLASNGAIDIKEWVADADGKVLRIIQTALEKELEKTISSNGTGNSMNFSRNLAKNGIKVIKGIYIKTKITNDTKFLQITGGKNTKYGHYEAGVFYKEKNGIDYANYQSYGAFLKGKWGNRYGKYGELGIGAKLTQSNIAWNTGIKKTYNTIGTNISWDKNLLKTNKDEINIGASLEGNILFDKEKDIYSAGVTSLGGIQDASGNGGVTVDWEHKINQNWSTNLGLMYGFDIGNKNIRSRELTLYNKYGIYGGLNYQKGDFGASLSGLYEKGLGYDKKKLGLNLRKGRKNKKGTFETQITYKEKKDKTKFHLEPEKEAKIGLVYNLTDSLKLNTYGYKKNDMGISSSGIGAGFTYTF